MSSIHTQKPILLFSALPLDGHIYPTMRVATHMVNRGYEVVFITAAEHKDKIEKLGAEFVETPHFNTYSGPEWFSDAAKLPPGSVERLVKEMTGHCYKPMARATEIVGETLEQIRARAPGRQVIIITEVAVMSVLPFKHGRPLPRGYEEFPKTVGINVSVLFLQGMDVGPYTLGLPPDSTESGRLRNMWLHKFMLDGPLKALKDVQNKYMKAAGATSDAWPEYPALDAWIRSLDVLIQPCSPELEYPHSDLPSNIKFTGTLPRRAISDDTIYPEWWAEITENAQATEESKKKIVFVTQGTVAVDYNELVVPTLKALGGHEDVLVIVALGLRGAKLPDDFEVPSNTRVANFVPYDAILEHADVFVYNAGYGGLLHAVNNATPLVAAGETQDKNEVSARIEYSGLGVNLKTQTPGSLQIREAVNKILGDPQYKQRAVEMQKINRDMDAFSRIEREIEALTQVT